jgi:hypothetical protein
LAVRLAETEGIIVETLTVIPYLGGKPAGLPEHEDLAWVDHTLFMTDLSKARLVRKISETIAGAFDWSELKVILAYGFGRSAQEIHAYLGENFSLDPEKVDAPVQELRVESAAALNSLPADKEGPGEPDLSSLPAQQMDEAKAATNSPQSDVIDASLDQQKRPSSPKAPQIRNPLIERFALFNGFHKNGIDQFSHSNGNILTKADGAFPWHVQNPEGAPFRYYWTKEHCLQTKPLELPTEIWHLIEENPHDHALILEDTDGNPIEMHGIDLIKLREDGKLKLFPASYRLMLTLQD